MKSRGAGCCPIEREDIELVEAVHGDLNTEEYLGREKWLRFFGSAVNNLV